MKDAPPTPDRMRPREWLDKLHRLTCHCNKPGGIQCEMAIDYRVLSRLEARSFVIEQLLTNVRELRANRRKETT
jgi:hypothetical protein